MKITGKILLTGITGAVGSWIAGEALNNGISVAAIVRGGSAGKVRQVLDLVGCQSRIDGVGIVDGDICSDLTYLADKKELADVSVIVHCAAATDFSDTYSEQSFQVNINGTKNILSLAAKMKLPVCYISTAYIAGSRLGVVKESEVDVGQGFCNIYEQTKCQAELYVHQWARETGLPVFVFRPSIVIGDSRYGRIATFNGMYNILRFFNSVSPIIKNECVRAVAKADATKNFIPVDYLAKAIWYIMQKGSPATYHITHPSPLSLEQLRRIYEGLFGVSLAIVTEQEYKSKKPTKAEMLYQKSSLLYKPYMASEPIFDRTNTDAVLSSSDIKMPVIDIDYFSRLLEYAKSAQWGKSLVGVSNKAGSTNSFIEKYFDVFLSSKMNQLLLPDLRKLSSTFRIVLRDVPDLHWSVAIKSGALTEISKNGMPCECSFLVDRDTFGRITSGQITPQQAFFKKQVDIEGNIETGLKLVTVLAAFFKRHPYGIEENRC